MLMNRWFWFCVWNGGFGFVTAPGSKRLHDQEVEQANHVMHSTCMPGFAWLPLICTAARSRQDLQPVLLFSRHSTLCLLAPSKCTFARSQEDLQPVEPIFITPPPCWAPLICTAARSQQDLQPIEPIFITLHLAGLPSYALLPGPSKIYSRLSLFFHHSTFAMNMKQNKQDIKYVILIHFWSLYPNTLPTEETPLELTITQIRKLFLCLSRYQICPFKCKKFEGGGIYLKSSFMRRGTK